MDTKILIKMKNWPMERERKPRSLFWHTVIYPAWKWFIVGPPWFYGWFAFFRDEFLPSHIRESWRIGGVFNMIPWYWWVIISLFALFVITAVVKSKPPASTAMNQKTEVAPNNVSLLNSMGELKWAPVIYENTSWWGDHMVTYAIIRIDDRSNCHDLVARLVKVTRNNINMNIDTINPTGNDLGWRQEGNRCILQVVAEFDNDTEFVFMNKRRSPPLVPGEYTIEIVLSNMADSRARQTKIVKELRVNKPHHYDQIHETGLEWH